MKKSILFLSAITLLFSSCEKEENSASFPYLPELNENLVLRTEEDATTMVSFFTASPGQLCGFSDSTFDSSTSTYTLSFNGFNCDGDIQRSGVISAQLIAGTNWNDLGSQIKVSFINYTVSISNTGQTAVINGERLFTNISGSQDINNLQIGIGEIKQTCSGSITVQVSGESYMSWNESYTRTLRKLDFGNFVSVTKPASSGLPYSNVIRWGTDSKGGNYYNSVEDSIQAKLCYGTWKRFDGKYVIYSDANNGPTQLILGYNNSNAPITSNCESAKLKVLWVNDLGQTVESFRVIY